MVRIVNEHHDAVRSSGDRRSRPARRRNGPRPRWTDIQHRLTSGQRWVIDGDLGPYDVLDVRLRAADTVIVLDFPLWRCAWRALRRSRENVAFWRWVLTYRRRSLPTVMAAIASNAAHADLRVLRSPRAVKQLLNQTNPGTPPDQDPLTNP
jgi:adenylate kinase family enzyme